MNTETYNTYRRKWRADNPARRARSRRDWKRRNPEKVAAGHAVA